MEHTDSIEGERMNAREGKCARADGHSMCGAESGCDICEYSSISWMVHIRATAYGEKMLWLSKEQIVRFHQMNANGLCNIFAGNEPNKVRERSENN